jgi:hypothetical protein
MNACSRDFARDGGRAAEMQRDEGWNRCREPRVTCNRKAGRDASGDTWKPLDNLTNCEDAISAFELATGRTVPRPLPALPGRAAASPAPIAPVGFEAPPGDLGAALVGQTMLYWWPEIDGRQRGTVARLCQCPRGAFSHVTVAYSPGRQT